MKIGLAQMNTRSDKEENLQSATKLINTLAASGAELIMLPEYFNFIGSEELWPENAEEIENSHSLGTMRELAVQLGVHIHIGSIMERDNHNIYNTGIVVNRAGEIIARYRKNHLFDVEIHGGRRYFESENITPGNKTTTFTIEDITFGMATCYDLRFPRAVQEALRRRSPGVAYPGRIYPDDRERSLGAAAACAGGGKYLLGCRCRSVRPLCRPIT